MSALLEIKDLTLTLDRRATLIDGVSLSLDAGETLGLVGESGCGKSVTALAVTRLLADPPIAITGGRIMLDGIELTALDEAALCRVRGKHVGMIFQEPMTALNPVFTVGRQIAEAVRFHEGISSEAAWARAIEMLALVQIPDPEKRARVYPHEMSGGMRQRVMIAIALACGPKLLIADEPTTALDVTIQAQIVRLLARLRRELGMGVLLITHDLGLVAEICDRVAVMYAGRIVEQADIRALFKTPRHPYTRGLMAAVPSLAGLGARLAEIPGSVPDPRARAAGCSFAPRCPLVTARCREAAPPLAARTGDHAVACWEAP